MKRSYMPYGVVRNLFSVLEGHSKAQYAGLKRSFRHPGGKMERESAEIVIC